MPALIRLFQKFVQHGLKSADVLIGAAPQWVRASRPDPAMRAAVLDEEGRGWRPSPIGPLQSVAGKSNLSYDKFPGQPTNNNLHTYAIVDKGTYPSTPAN